MRRSVIFETRSSSGRSLSSSMNYEKGHNRRAYLAGCEGSHTTEEWLSLVEIFGRACAKCSEIKPLWLALNKK